MVVQHYCEHFDSSLFCNFIYRDHRQSSPLPQQIKLEAGKGHPIQSSDLLHIFLSVSLGGVAYRRRSGVILFLQHGVAMSVPFSKIPSGFKKNTAQIPIYSAYPLLSCGDICLLCYNIYENL